MRRLAVESCRDLFAEIDNRPEMFIDERSIFYLGVFLRGVETGQDLATTGLEERMSSLLVKFQEFVVERYGDGTNHSWERLIFHSSSNQSQAFATAMKLFKEFLGRPTEGGSD